MVFRNIVGDFLRMHGFVFSPISLFPSRERLVTSLGQGQRLAKAKLVQSSRPHPICPLHRQRGISPAIDEGVGTRVEVQVRVCWSSGSGSDASSGPGLDGGGVLS